MNPTVSETRILGMVLANLNTIPGCWFYRSSTGAAKVAAGRVIKFGVPGQADITGAAVGRAVYVETKTEIGKQSEAQKEFQRKVEAAGALYILARTREDAMNPVLALVAAASK